tara:strand:- start:25149 stop:26024 length:876 start_codon:yes stop_codon:yes gene_type:complete
MIEYPELFYAADRNATKAQRLHFNLIRLEYLLLVATGLVAWLGEHYNVASGIFGIAFIFLAAIATVSHFRQADAEWYLSRAMAESVKTISWQFMMRAVPYENTEGTEATEQFTSRLREILSNGANLPIPNSANPKSQVTEAMLHIRRSNIEERLNTYLEQRVSEQQNWYIEKAKSNANRATIWYFVVCLTYFTPLVLLVFNAIDMRGSWALVSVFLLIGSGLLGWTRSKRYRELSASYALTAREIALLRSSVSDVTTDEKLSDFVNSGELVFSREHTQWVARKFSKPALDS